MIRNIDTCSTAQTERHQFCQHYNVHHATWTIQWSIKRATGNSLGHLGIRGSRCLGLPLRWLTWPRRGQIVPLEGQSMTPGPPGPEVHQQPPDNLLYRPLDGLRHQEASPEECSAWSFVPSNVHAILSGPLYSQLVSILECFGEISVLALEVTREIQFHPLRLLEILHLAFSLGWRPATSNRRLKYPATTLNADMEAIKQKSLGSSPRTVKLSVSYCVFENKLAGFWGMCF